jgi:hypothetical protein
VTTATTIATDALGLIGITDPTDALEPEDANLALRVLNRLVDALGADSLFLLAVSYQAIPLTAAEITIGAAGEIAVTRPSRIELGAYVRVVDVDYPLERLNRDRWGEIALKASTGVPRYFNYEATSAVLGTLKFYPAPEAVYTAYLPLKQRLSSFADLTTNYSLADGYEEYLVSTLAVMLAPYYHREAPPSVVARSRIAKRYIKRLNTQVPQMNVDDLHRLVHGGSDCGIGGGGDGGEYLLID